MSDKSENNVFLCFCSDLDRLSMESISLREYTNQWFSQIISFDSKPLDESLFDSKTNSLIHCISSSGSYVYL
jgi:hypothetical protein